MKMQTIYTKCKSLLMTLTLLFAPFLLEAQYCTPTYTSSQCINYSMYIQDFTTTGGIQNITKTNSGCGNTSTSYIFYSTDKHAGVQGTSVNFTVKIGSEYPQGVKIYVDYNMDGDFTDAGEDVWTSSGAMTQGTSATGSFVIPAASPVGVTRMRVRCRYATNSIDPCNALDYGEAEDYVFEVIPSCSSKFLVDPSDITFCENSSTLMTVNTANTDAVKWQLNTGTGWYDLINGPNYSGVFTDTLKIMNSTMAMQNFQYRAVAINTGESCSVNSDPAKISLIPNTKSSIVIAAGSNTEICEHTPVTFTAAFTKAGTTPKFEWEVNGVKEPNAKDATYITDSLMDNDEVRCFLISSEICVFPELSLPIKFTVHDYVNPAVDIQVIFEGEGQYMFKAIPTNGGTAPIYQWFRHDKPVVGATSDEYRPQDIQPWERITVTMVSSERCVNPTMQAVSSSPLTASVRTIAPQISDIALHPNPNTGRFNISGRLADDAVAKDVHVIITNTVGQTVYSKTFNPAGTDILLPVTLGDNIANGVYTVNLSVDGKSANIRFVLNR